MERLATSGEIYRLFLAEDEKTIIRKPNLRYFARDNGVEHYVYEKAWLINFEQFMKKLNPKDMKEYYSLPRMRHRNASVKKGEREKCRHNRRRAQKERSGIAKWCYRFDNYGLPGGNRTHNRDLGGPRYIHLTTRRNIEF